MEVFKQNPIIARGMSDPRCQAALQLMQTDPKEAQKRFQHDQEVNVFLQEFGKVMSGHFDALGAKEQQQQESQQVPHAAAGVGAATSGGGSKILDMDTLGPLHKQHKQAIKKGAR